MSVKRNDYLVEFLKANADKKLLKRRLKKKYKPARASRKLEIDYTKTLLGITADCKAAGKVILAALKSNRHFVGDAIDVEAMMAISREGWHEVFTEQSESLFVAINARSGAIARKVVAQSVDVTDKAFSGYIKAMTGVDMVSMLIERDLVDYIDDAVNANVSLIKTIPANYFNTIEGKVNTAFQNGWTYNQLQDEIISLGHSTDARARVIARDQIGKINGQFNQARQESIGAEGYDWSTSRDERVRGNPGGKYPKVKHSHYTRDGKRYLWKEPPVDGHPGYPIQCRCTAIADLSYLLE